MEFVSLSHLVDTKMSPLSAIDSVNQRGFVVAVLNIDMDTLEFSNNVEILESEKDLDCEMTRLVLKNPGVTFVGLKIVSTAYTR
jgi:hypothetical protein